MAELEISWASGEHEETDWMEKEPEGEVEEQEPYPLLPEPKELETEPGPSLPEPEPPLPEPRRGAKAGVSADDGKAQQHFEQSLGKRTEKKEEIVLVVCLVISSHVRYLILK